MIIILLEADTHPISYIKPAFLFNRCSGHSFFQISVTSPLTETHFHFLVCQSLHMFSPAVLIRPMSNHFLNTKAFLALSVAFRLIPSQCTRSPLFVTCIDIKVFYPQSQLRIVIYCRATSLCLQICVLFKLKTKPISFQVA